MFFNKNEKQEPSKTTKQKVERKIKEMAGQPERKLAEKTSTVMVSTEQKRSTTPKLVRKEEKPVRSSRTNQIKKKEPISVIETWTGEDMIKGIVLSEVLGPPKSKRKK
ncbi:hypothetical protein [Domibacillus iocasae]|uniref:Uncharacterized protein n=1 Tax=Domibacillus iocasae TaxID=1714016 RepID=A0A1E7DMP4_9BACI|nr:hypothetical protein [Domibacillus iocasae]OES44329.1 hypothetical protein BA724_08565 [Domibacillus iocasae]